MTNSQNRQFKRGPLQLPVSFTLNEVAKEGYLSNLSAGGCLLYCYLPFAIKSNHPIELLLKLNIFPYPIKIIGHVAWVESFIYNPNYALKEEINYQMGIQFLDLDEGEKKAIDDYAGKVLERMRQEDGAAW